MSRRAFILLFLTAAFGLVGCAEKPRHVSIAEDRSGSALPPRCWRAVQWRLDRGNDRNSETIAILLPVSGLPLRFRLEESQEEIVIGAAEMEARCEEAGTGTTPGFQRCLDELRERSHNLEAGIPVCGDHRAYAMSLRLDRPIGERRIIRLLDPKGSNPYEGVLRYRG